ncbi:MAG TPA: PHB depolymerase family esterase [Noviherbaspirillum sp.]|nr:PHB depolymerase family esterase [Noviherbaspirillum sp.]
MKLNERFLAQMREATILLESEGPMAATAAIQRALNAHSGPAGRPNQPAQGGRGAEPAEDATPLPSTSDAGAARTDAWFDSIRRQAADAVQDVEFREMESTESGSVGSDSADSAGSGRFLSGACSNSAGTREYKLYVPRGYVGQPLPLIVMLHGCTQDPDDFAAGTGMNILADEQNFLVVYPAQSKNANTSNCWNWFQPTHQARDRGEPSLIADITRKVVREYQVDERRIYVAGLSAGGAMAAVLGARYPDLYAAIGVHSGLPLGVARDVVSAFAAMKGGKGKASSRAATAHPPATLGHTIPVIVFHGDRDRTVHGSNGDKVLEQCIAAGDPACAKANVEVGMARGRRYTRAVHRDAQGRAYAEKWTVHGAGHAWAGGSKKGSYTDPGAPDASREMVRFFLSHALPGSD